MKLPLIAVCRVSPSLSVIGFDISVIILKFSCSTLQASSVVDLLRFSLGLSAVVLEGKV